MVHLTMIINLPHPNKILIPSLIFLVLISLRVASSEAVECQTSSDCASQANQISKDLSSVETQLKSLSTQLKSASADYYQINEELSKAEVELSKVKKKLDDKKEDLVRQVSLRNYLVRELYKQSRLSPLDAVLASTEAPDISKNVGYFLDNLDQLEEKITTLNTEITQYEKNKKAFEKLKKELASEKSNLSSEIGQINYLTSYYNNRKLILGSDLNVAMQQQAILAWQEKQAGNGKKSLGGAGSFTFYGYGTEHGVGMSQYGAKKLGDQGKTGEYIIKFYYPGIQISTKSTNSRYIKTTCAGTLKFEDQYLAGIGEVPNSWGAGVKEALIIAARSYAYPDTFASGGSPPRVVPCDDSYQVYLGGTGKLSAVNSTRGRVATYDGVVRKLYYYSTSGPHTDSIWDSAAFSCTKASCPYLGTVKYNDDNSPYNNWCGLAKVWDSTPPSAACTGSDVGKPLTNADLELVLNASLLKNQNCQIDSSGKCLSSWCNRTDVGHLQCVSIKSTPQQISTWLKQEGTKVFSGIKSINLVRKCYEYSTSCSSQRVLWVTATGTSRNINSGIITGTRFRYVFNILSPEGDSLWSKWFYVK
ncbi:MAG: SpoIID/LytB domain-containing protein [Patescibacteria group bacterium]